MIKDKINIFRLKKIDDDKIEGVRNLLRLNKDNKTIKYRIIGDIRNYNEQEKEDYYKPIKVGNIWSRIYIEYEVMEI